MRNIDTPTLNLIASTCGQLEQLIITCELSHSQDYLAAFGSGYLPQLQRLEVDCEGPQLIDEEIVTAIFLHHPLLTEFVLQSTSVSPLTCAKNLSTNPTVVRFSCRGFTFRVVSDEADADTKHCKLIFGENEIIRYPSQMYREGMLQLSCSHLYPILHLECFAPYLDNEDLITVASVVGGNLRTFTTDLNNTVDDDNVVQQLTLLCPVLEVLYLNIVESITDLSLHSIGNNCKCVTKLSLYQGNLITDFGICHLLFKIGEQLTELLLVNLSLTGASLVPILSVCSNLKVLKIDEAGIPTEDIQVQLLSSTQNRLPKLVRLLVDMDAFDVLMDFVTNPANECSQHEMDKDIGMMFEL